MPYHLSLERSIVVREYGFILLLTMLDEGEEKLINYIIPE